MRITLGKENKTMKRLLAIILILMMLVSSAYAAEWAPGLGPHKPYEGVPEIDLETQFGTMMFHPNSRMSVAGTKTLFIYLPREDVNAGSGRLILRSSDNGEEFRTSFDDTTYVTLRPMTENEKVDLIWGSGVCFEITLPKSLRLGTTYSVDLDNNAIVTSKIGNPAVNGQQSWNFTTIGDYGVGEMEYRRLNANGTYQEGILVPQAGDEIRFDIALGGDAVMAVIYAGQGVSFEETNFSESREVIGVVTDDEALMPGAGPIWTVIFLNANGEEIDFVAF